MALDVGPDGSGHVAIAWDLEVVPSLSLSTHVHTLYIIYWKLSQIISQKKNYVYVNSQLFVFIGNQTIITSNRSFEQHERGSFGQVAGLSAHKDSNNSKLGPLYQLVS